MCVCVCVRGGGGGGDDRLTKDWGGVEGMGIEEKGGLLARSFSTRHFTGGNSKQFGFPMSCLRLI